MDHYTRRVTGRATAPRGRVVWRSNRLYVFAPSADVSVFDAPDKPQSTGRTDTGRDTYETAGVQWDKGPCGCGFPRDLKRAVGTLVREADALIESGAVVVQPLETEAANA